MQTMGRTTAKTRTLDSEHRELCAGFEKAASKRDLLTAQLKDLNTELERLKAAPSPEWTRMVQVKDDIIRARDELVRIRHEYDEISYYTTTSPILFQYYESFKPSVNPIALRPIHHHQPAVPAQAKKSTIMSFFARRGGGGNNSSNNSSGASTPRESCKDHSGAAAGAAAKLAQRPDLLEKPDQRGSLFERFLERVDKNFIKHFPESDNNVCPFCKQNCMQVISCEGVAFCTHCHHSEKVMLEVEKPFYKEPPADVTHYAYKRINHFNEWLNQIQGKEYTDIPPGVIDSILLELKKRKIKNMALLDNKTVREILRKLGINKYYEHIPYIMYKLTGIHPPRLGEELEEQMRQMFYAVQMPYLKHCPVTRKNFLSYSYVMHKQLQLLGRPEFTKYFPLLKSREKLHQQEQIWRKICGEIGWDFHPSI
jgi:hypothetical protein